MSYWATVRLPRTFWKSTKGCRMRIYERASSLPHALWHEHEIRSAKPPHAMLRVLAFIGRRLGYK